MNCSDFFLIFFEIQLPKLVQIDEFGQNWMIVLKRKTLQTTESAENKILKLSTSGNDLYYRKLHELQFVFYRKLQIITCKMFSVIGLERMLNFLYLLSILDLFVSILLSLHMLEPRFNVDYHQSYIRAFVQAPLRTI